MKKYVAEYVGTLILVLVACGVAVVTGANVVATSLAFGLVIVAMAYSIGNVSGCHINPAVSLAMFLTGKLNVKELIAYVSSQILGAISGAALLGVFLDSFDALGANSFGDSMGATNAWIAILVEVILTFIFITVILSVTNKKEHSNIAGIIIGLTLTVVHLIGIYFTGTSVNPARSLAPALLQGGEVLKQVWVFIISPLIGSTLAVFFYKNIIKEK